MKKQIKKSFLVIFLIISMLFSTSVSALSRWSCNDVKYGMWFYDAIYNLKNCRIMFGDGNDNFYPNRLITRGELIALFARTDFGYSEENGKYTKSHFVDVNEKQYYSQAVAWAEDKGIVHGVSEKYFAPDDLVTREQFFVIIANYVQRIGYPLENIKQIQFIDIDNVSHWAKESALLCAHIGIVSGFPDGTLQPKATLQELKQHR